jgi:hypothetical protein
MEWNLRQKRLLIFGYLLPHIASVYMIIFGSIIGDILFGVFFPIGLLVLAGLIVTLYLASSKS